MAKRFPRALLILLAAFALCFLLLPLVVLVIRAYTAQAWSELPQTGILQAILLSVLTTLATVLFTLLFGTPLAYIFARWRFPFLDALATPTPAALASRRPSKESTACAPG